MKKILLAAAVSIFSTSAFATDMPYRGPMPAKAAYAAPVTTWNGCYAGITGGWARISGSGDHIDGADVGGTLGCNVQTGNWVYGIESDAMWNSASESALGVTLRQNFLGSVRGRLGVTSSNALYYATGGLGVGHIEVNTTPSFDDWHTGWVAGVGVEWIVAQNWTAKVEYLHYSFDVNGSGGGGGGVAFSGGGQYHADTVKVGLNYQFGSVR